MYNFDKFLELILYNICYKERECDGFNLYVQKLCTKHIQC